MSDTTLPISPLPPDDLSRKLSFVHADGDGKFPHIGMVGDTYTITVAGEDTNDRFCVIDMHIPPNGGPGPHRHDFDETFILLEGEIEVTFRGERSTVRKGDTVNIPPNAPHMFKNTSAQPARMICICAPAGNERFFLEVGVPVAGRTTPPPQLNEKEMGEFIQKARAIAPKYHTELLESA